MTVPQRKRYCSNRLLTLPLHKAGFFIFIPSCLYGRTFKWPKSIIQIKLQRIKVRVPANTTVLFVLLTGGFNMLSQAKLLKPWLVPGRLSQPLPCRALGLMGRKNARESLPLFFLPVTPCSRRARYARTTGDESDWNLDLSRPGLRRPSALQSSAFRGQPVWGGIWVISEKISM